jgi:hypothetical protein
MGRRNLPNVVQIIASAGVAAAGRRRWRLVDVADGHVRLQGPLFRSRNRSGLQGARRARSRRLSRQPSLNRADGMSRPVAHKSGKSAAAARGRVLLAADRELPPPSRDPPIARPGACRRSAEPRSSVPKRSARNCFGLFSGNESSECIRCPLTPVRARCHHAPRTGRTIWSFRSNPPGRHSTLCRSSVRCPVLETIRFRRHCRLRHPCPYI